jgi:hypothetical protein
MVDTALLQIDVPKFASAKGMMHQSMISHGRTLYDVRSCFNHRKGTSWHTSRVADDMYHRYKLGIGTSVTAVCAELAWPESRHKRPDAAETAIAVRGVGSDELIWIATEIHAGLPNEVQ